MHLECSRLYAKGIRSYRESNEDINQARKKLQRRRDSCIKSLIATYNISFSNERECIILRYWHCMHGETHTLSRHIVCRCVKKEAQSAMHGKIFIPSAACNS